MVKKHESLFAPKYWLWWGGMGLFRALIWLPFPMIMAIGRYLGRILYRRVSSRVAFARTNIALCFPQMSKQEQEALVLKHFESVGMGLMELGLCWWGDPKKFLSRVETQGLEQLEPAFEHGKGVIYLSAHFTSLELGGRVLAHFAPIYPMYRPHENPLLNHLMIKHREKNIGPVIPRDDVRSMVKALRDNKGVWFAPDQNFGHKGRLFVDFFSIPAATNTSVSRFVKMTDAVVLPYVLLRKEDHSGYRMIIEPPMSEEVISDPEGYANHYNSQIMTWTLTALPQYNWMHRRFKERPAGESGFY
jgi:KDO2-lipid IV(A) lauroyltransferase